MHRAAYRELGLDWTYDAIDVPSGGLSAFAAELGEEWAGLSVTAPLKREAAKFASVQTDVVKVLGVANTLLHTAGSWRADNTDVPGAVNALRERGVTSVESVRILGAGATAESMLLAVRELGATSIEVWARTPAKVRLKGVTTRQLADPVSADVDLLISTLPGDSAGDRAKEWVSTAAAVFDVSYHPWPTPLAGAVAPEQPFATGLDLLAHQAVLQVELMTGQRVDPDILRAAAVVG